MEYEEVIRIWMNCYYSRLLFRYGSATASHLGDLLRCSESGGLYQEEPDARLLVGL